MLIGKEHMSVTLNPFGTHTTDGVYLNADGTESSETFEAGESYLIHKYDPAHAAEDHGGDHADDHGGHALHIDDYQKGQVYEGPGYRVDEKGFVHRKFKFTTPEGQAAIGSESFGPKAFGALFFFITGFHGFHVFSGVAFLLIIMLNVASGLYVKRRNGYEMVEKIGLYWHFVDLVWVFVFLLFYLL